MPPDNPNPGKIPELLAPAGSPAAFHAALAAGADAVYLSGRQFGARKFAPNFTDAEIGEAIAAAHAKGVRVYVTVNTLIHDRELAGAAEYLVRLYAAGVDAVLVQDAGLAALARRIVPGLTLHASTQMTIHDAAGVRWAAGLGLSRVVLARELSLEQVKAIAEKTCDTGVGLEVFAHGALCYAYSGQCLLSSFMGGRSGNRGMCAQPCRKQYVLVTADTDEYGRPVRTERRPLPCRHLLSPRDLCTYENLAMLVQSPVVSLKIEGRMKSPEYVATVVSVYRRALDALAKGSWTPSPEDRRELLLAFNRGFTPGHLFRSRGAALMGRDAPDNRGILIGTVTGYDPSTRNVSISVCGPVMPGPGDGLLITSPGKEDEESGFSLNNTPVPGKKGTIVFSVPGMVKPGASVYLTASREHDARVRQIIARPDRSLRHPVPLDITAIVGEDGSLTLKGTARNARGTPVSFETGPEPAFIPARSNPLTPAELEDRLRKTGGTSFGIGRLDLHYAKGMFAPPAAINTLRRGFLALAEESMVTSCIPQPDSVSAAREVLRHAIMPLTPAGRSPGPAGQPAIRLAVIADSPDAANAAVEAGCDLLWYEPGAGRDRDCGEADTGGIINDEITSVLARCRAFSVQVSLCLPRLAGEEMTEGLLPILPVMRQAGLAGIMTDNPGTAWIIRNALPSFPVSGAAGLNIFNHATAATFAGLFGLMVLSPELSADEIRTLVGTARAQGHGTEFALIVQGSAEAMISADDLPGVLLPGSGTANPVLRSRFTGLADSTGRIFPIRTDPYCRTHILNADETCLVDQLPQIRAMGISVIVIDIRSRPPAYARAMTCIYRDAVSAMEENGPETVARLLDLKNRVKAIALGGITAGHFLRGLAE